MDALMALKYGRNKDYVIKNLGNILAYSDEYYSTERGEHYFDVIFLYLSQTLNLKIQEIREVMEALPTNIKKQGMNTYQRIIEQGIEQAVIGMLEEGLKDDLILKVLKVSKEQLEAIKKKL